MMSLLEAEGLVYLSDAAQMIRATRQSMSEKAMRHCFASPPCWLSLADVVGLILHMETVEMMLLVEAKGLMMSPSVVA